MKKYPPLEWDNPLMQELRKTLIKTGWVLQDLGFENDDYTLSYIAKKVEAARKHLNNAEEMLAARQKGMEP